MICIGSTSTFSDVDLLDIMVGDNDGQDCHDDEFAKVLVRNDVVVGLTAAVELAEGLCRLICRTRV